MGRMNWRSLANSWQLLCMDVGSGDMAETHSVGFQQISLHALGEYSLWSPKGKIGVFKQIHHKILGQFLFSLISNFSSSIPQSSAQHTYTNLPSSTFICLRCVQIRSSVRMPPFRAAICGRSNKSCARTYFICWSCFPTMAWSVASNVFSAFVLRERAWPHQLRLWYDCHFH